VSRDEKTRLQLTQLLPAKSVQTLTEPAVDILPWDL
jgi:hypothetical protein